MREILPALRPSPGATSPKAAAPGRALHVMRHGYLLGHERRRQGGSARTRTSDGGFGGLCPGVPRTLEEQRLSIVRRRVRGGRLRGDRDTLPFACHRTRRTDAGTPVPRAPLVSASRLHAYVHVGPLLHAGTQGDCQTRGQGCAADCGGLVEWLAASIGSNPARSVMPGSASLSSITAFARRSPRGANYDRESGR
jgi:hypothetical protein